MAPLAELPITDICSRVRRAVSNFMKIGSENLSFGLTVPLNASKADVEVLQRPAPDPWRPAARFDVSNHRPGEQRLVRQVELRAALTAATPCRKPVVGSGRRIDSCALLPALHRFGKWTDFDYHVLV